MNPLEQFKSLLDEDGGEEDEEFSSQESAYRGSTLDRFAYALFGGFFRGQDDTYAQYNRKLNQARIPVSYDVYLSRITLFGILAAITGVVLGVGVTLLLDSLLLALGVDIQVPQGVANFLQQNALLVRGFLVTFTLTVLLFVGVVGTLYYRPYYIAGERAREINNMLPHAVTFMYAMSRGGVNILGVLRALAEAETTYGAVSEEFAAVVNNVEYVQEDLQTAVREEAAITPSDDLRAYMEDLLNVIDSGSDMEQFFLNKSEVYLQEVKHTQEQTLDVLELMSEAYVTLFVASPIFVIVILMVMSLMGTPKLMYLYAMTYFALPMGAVFFTVMMKLISPSATAGNAKMERPGRFNQGNEYDPDNDPRYKVYQREEMRRSFLSSLLAPIRGMRNNPLYTLVFTLPVAIAFMAWAHTSGLATLSPDAFFNKPVWTTGILVVLPVYIVGVPMSVLHELKMRREKAILKKLPEAFKSAAEANARGLTLGESFRLVADNSDGVLARELEYAFNQASWTSNLNDALISLGNKLRVPRFTRTLKLITQANRTSGDVQSVLEVAARDVENMHDLDKERKQNAMTYLVIIILAFFIALGVIAMLDSAFLSSIASQGAENASNASSSASSSGSSGGSGGMSSGGFGDFPIKKFRMAFMHTTMVLGFTAGLVAGAMASDSVLSGLKFSLFSFGFAVLVFAFL